LSVKISAALPADDASGLGALADALEANPFQAIPVVGLMIPSRRIAEFDRPEDPTVHVLRFQSIEPIEIGSDLADTVREALAKAHEMRTGARRLFGEDG
jgi:hypothetical protein